MMKRFLISISFLALIGIIGGLGGCGIKPSDVDAPHSTKQDQFPRTYPDIATDPK